MIGARMVIIIHHHYLRLHVPATLRYRAPARVKESSSLLLIALKRLRLSIFHLFADPHAPAWLLPLPVHPLTLPLQILVQTQKPFPRALSTRHPRLHEPGQDAREFLPLRHRGASRRHF